MAKSTAKKSTTAPAKPPAGVTPPPPPGASIEDVKDSIRQTEDEQREARLEAARDAIEELSDTVTQREWLLVCNKLGRTRQEVVADASLRILALAWVREKRDHGGADWDKLLDMTDDQLLEVHGISTEDTQAERDKARAEDSGGA